MSDLTIKVWEVTHGWAWAAYTGDGSEPGSVEGGAGAFPTAQSAWDDAAERMKARLSVAEARPGDADAP